MCMVVLRSISDRMPGSTGLPIIVGTAIKDIMIRGGIIDMIPGISAFTIHSGIPGMIHGGITIIGIIIPEIIMPGIIETVEGIMIHGLRRNENSIEEESI